MSNFIARVQFQTESDRKYTILRDNLLTIGFTKRVTSKEGIEYRLPNSNYRVESEKDILEVLTAVQKIAFKIEKTAMIFICESTEKGLAWSNLQRC